MSSRSKIGLGGGVLLILLAVWLGRVVEQRAVAMNSLALGQRAPAPTPTNPPEPLGYRELTIADIIALPFADFYEALRSAPGEAREKWRLDLERMPAGPRKNAAVAGFYKLLVQFDPVTAAKNACEVDDKDLRSLALESVVSAAPGFALKDVAEIFLKVATEPYNAQPYLERVVSAWTDIDPAAVARFYDEHPEFREHLYSHELIKAWAALDPKAARQWLEARDFGPDVVAAFVMGWYINDPSAAVEFAIANADELGTLSGLDGLLTALYLDSKEEAKKFIERLPSDEFRNKAFRGFEFAVESGTAEETGEPDKTPRAIADWIIQFPVAWWRGHLGSAFSCWPKDSMRELFTWIEERPPEIRDAVADEFTVSTASAPEAAAAVIQYASAPRRDQLLTAMFQNSPSNISQWRESIKTSSLLSAADKNRVLEIASQVETALDEERKRKSEEAAANEDGTEQ